MSQLMSVLCVAICIGVLAAPARADQVTDQDVVNPGKPKILPLVNVEVGDGFEQIYIQNT